MSISEIIQNGSLTDKKALFVFDSTNSDEEVILKFNLWSRYFFNRYYKVKPAPFHDGIDRANLAVYRYNKREFINSAYRKAAKTTLTKLFVAFCIANDQEHSVKYVKILSHEQGNSTQFVTDIYNMLATISEMYPEIFVKTTHKREETMSSFTTSTGVKVLATTVGKAQRGSLQEDARPDLQIFDDFETRTTLRSAVISKAIWDNMEEARNGGKKSGEGCIYLCNYISELGNVHKLMERSDNKQSIVLDVPIIDDAGVIQWPEAHTQEDVDFLKKTAEDFEGEFLNKPSASKDIYFPRDELDKQEYKTPIEVVGGTKVFHEYKPSNRYGGGNDVAGGVGLDSSASVIINFDTYPARVVATYHSNTIDPEAFGDKIYDDSLLFGKCIVGIENNKFDQAVLKAKQRGALLYKSIPKENRIGVHKPTQYGWNTNSLTKTKMLSDLKSAIEDGLLELSDEELIKEMKSYSRNDLIDREPDARLTTRHFDLVIACAVAWQMKDYAKLGDNELTRSQRLMVQGSERNRNIKPQSR